MSDWNSESIDELNHHLSGIRDSLSFLSDELKRIFEPIGNLHMDIAKNITKIADELEEQGQ